MLDVADDATSIDTSLDKIRQQPDRRKEGGTPRMDFTRATYTSKLQTINKYHPRLHIDERTDYGG